MKFRTEIPLDRQPLEAQINYKSKTVFLGSCFSTNIGEQFNYFKFQNLVNPFGVLFHPIAVTRLIQRALNNTFFKEEDLIYHNDCYHCFDVHSQFSNANKLELLDELNAALTQCKTAITTASHIIITLGTSWVYEHIDTNTVVANCHKVPQKQFNKRLLSVGEITSVLNEMLKEITAINNKIQFIFTVSPVRHIKDGVVENQLSKAHLVSAIHGILQQEHKSKVAYYPAYEIMMDDLREYRFYKEDMIHPNQVAVNYIWDHFKKTWMNEAVFEVMDKVDEIQKGLSHKPFNPSSEAHQRFLEKLAQKKQELEQQVPEITF